MSTPTILVTALATCIVGALTNGAVAAPQADWRQGSVRATVSATPQGEPAPRTLRQRLEAIPGMHVTSVDHPRPHQTYFQLTFRQLVDHHDAGGRTFTQRLGILHVGSRRPTTIDTTGYSLFPFPYVTEPTRLLHANQVSVEERYFASSIPRHADWSKMTIWQAAADHHRLIQALKSIYHGRWIATGASKGGMASTYHRRFFPADVAGTVAYVAPNDVRNFRDSYVHFINHAGDKPTCNRKLRVVQKQALKRRDTLVPMVRRENRRHGNTVDATVGSWDRSFEATVEDTPFQFWQYYDASFCVEIPGADATDRQIYRFFKTFYGWTFNTDEGSANVSTYFYQAALQLGWPEEAKGAWWLDGLLHYRLAYSAPALTPRSIRPDHFQVHAMGDIDRWVRHRAQRMLFVYGENDPWSAEAFHVGRGAVDSHVYYAPKGNHGSTIASLRPRQRDRARAMVRRWAGLPPRSAKTVADPYAGIRTEESIRMDPAYRD